MPERSGPGALIAATLVFGVVLAAANGIGIALLAESLQTPAFDLGGPGLTEKIGAAVGALYSRFPGYFWLFFILPVALFAFTALLIGLRGDSGAPTTAASAAPVAADRGTRALQLLGILQQEGRLIDFLEEDIDGYSDDQVGAAARTVHGGCRKALHERMRIRRVHDADDGAAVEIGADYDPLRVRLTGNVHGQPPFRGTLEHGGWQVADLRMPDLTGGDPAILAPAEVEIP
jgi:hypothetical protein